jgi:hypothetical protein
MEAQAVSVEHNMRERQDLGFMAQAVSVEHNMRQRQDLGFMRERQDLGFMRERQDLGFMGFDINSLYGYCGVTKLSSGTKYLSVKGSETLGHNGTCALREMSASGLECKKSS